jgi:Cu2+-exporting ATPase
MFLSSLLISGIVVILYRKNKNKTKKSKSKRLLLADTRKNASQTVVLKPDDSNKKSTALGLVEDINNTDQTDKNINKKLAISLVSLSVAVLFPPLRPLSWLGFLYASADFFKQGCHAAVKKRQINMAVVDSVMFTGLIVTNHLIAGALMCSFLWFAQKILFKTEDRSRKSLVNIFGEQPRSVWILKNGIEIECPFEQLTIGDTLMVNAGETIPAVGCITQGVASIDQHMLTGESQPAEKTVGDSVFAATIVLSGKIHLQVEKAGTESVAAQIGTVLTQTADFKTQMQARWMQRVDKTAPLTLGVGLAALPVLGPSSAVSLLYSFNYGYSMRVIAPATMMNFLHVASETGILIKDGRSLEVLKKVDTLIFDKTGTLTLDQPVVGQIHCCNDYSEDALLVYAAAAEYRQTHPVAKAILHAADERGLVLPDSDAAHYQVGYGIQVRLGKKTIHVGSPRFMSLSDITIPNDMQRINEQCHDNGNSLIMIAVDQQLEGAIELCAVLRPEAKKIVDALHQQGMSLYIISGDHQNPTQQLAKSLGILHYFAETLPEKKADIVASLQQEGKVVCFIGDGINDSIALKKADVSISMRGATTLATDTAQIILMDGSLKQLEQLFTLGNNYHHNIQRSFLMTLAPSAIAVGGILFFHFGIVASIILYYSGLTAGMSNAILPLFKQKERK